MKPPKLIALALLGCQFLWLSSQAQITGFDCDPAGIDLVVTADQVLELPPDGRLCFRKITVAPGTTLRFKRNALNTPVQLLATEDVEVQGTIDVSGGNGTGDRGGVGGPGGFDGGSPGSPSGSPPGPGHGPGGGKPGTQVGGFQDPQPEHSGSGGFAMIGFNGQLPQDGNRYGNRYGTPILIPLIGGSGGGGATSVGGGGGGGALLIASKTRITIAAPGHLNANGGTSARTSYGSGGGIRLVAPVVAGNGIVTANGGSAIDVRPNPGRIRVDTRDRSGAALSFFQSTPSYGAAMTLGLVQPPALYITEAAGQVIPVGTDNPVTVVLPPGSPTTANVSVESRGFLSGVPVQVALTPEHGARQVFDALIPVGADGRGRVEVPVEFPVNVPTLVQVWTR